MFLRVYRSVLINLAMLAFAKLVTSAILASRADRERKSVVYADYASAEGEKVSFIVRWIVKRIGLMLFVLLWTGEQFWFQHDDPKHWVISIFLNLVMETLFPLMIFFAQHPDWSFLVKSAANTVDSLLMFCLLIPFGILLGVEVIATARGVRWFGWRKTLRHSVVTLVEAINDARREQAEGEVPGGIQLQDLTVTDEPARSNV